MAKLATLAAEKLKNLAEWMSGWSAKMAIKSIKVVNGFLKHARIRFDFVRLY